jgi:transcriptional regulator with XRE-family HTH domain
MDKDVAIVLGNAARQARKALKLTQENMAERLDVSVEFYGRIERGVAWPSLETFTRMIDVLGVSADTLLDTGVVRVAMAESSRRPGSDDPPELGELVPILREARPVTLRIASLLISELERAARERAPAHRKRSRKRLRKRRRGTRKPPPASSDGA